jgi:hypothetical protein
MDFRRTEDSKWPRSAEDIKSAAQARYEQNFSSKPFIETDDDNYFEEVFFELQKLRGSSGDSRMEAIQRGLDLPSEIAQQMTLGEAKKAKLQVSDLIEFYKRLQTDLDAASDAFVSTLKKAQRSFCDIDEYLSDAVSYRKEMRRKYSAQRSEGEEAPTAKRRKIVDKE